MNVTPLNYSIPATNDNQRDMEMERMLAEDIWRFRDAWEKLGEEET